MRTPIRPILIALVAAIACRSGRGDDTRTTIIFAGSALGAEGAVLARQVARFEVANPGIHVRIQHTPDDATQRHQLFVQWLNARAGEPDVSTPSRGPFGVVRRTEEMKAHG